VKLLESSEYEVTDFKKVLDDGRYRRDSRELMPGTGVPLKVP